MEELEELEKRVWEIRWDAVSKCQELMSEARELEEEADKKRIELLSLRDNELAMAYRRKVNGFKSVAADLEDIAHDLRRESRAYMDVATEISPGAMAAFDAADRANWKAMNRALRGMRTRRPQNVDGVEPPEDQV